MNNLCAQQESFREILVRPKISEGDHNRSLLMVVEWKKLGVIQKPPFQRDYVWPSDKLRGWIETVIEGKAIGTIVTYQIYDSLGKLTETYWLADGLQRITATERFLDNPQGYDFTFGGEQARAYCESFGIPIQHRYYKNHNEAMRAFQNLNLGTALTTAEFFKGELSLTRWGETIYKNVPMVVERLREPLASKKKLSRRTNSTLLRDSLALFLQFASGCEIKSFWNVSRAKPNLKEKQVEIVLRKWLSDNNLSVDELERRISNFDQFLSGQTRLIEGIRDETGQKGKEISRTVYQWLMHLAIWRKNTGWPVSRYEDFVRALFLSLKEHRTLCSRFDVSDPDDPKRKIGVTLRINDLGRVIWLGRVFGIPMDNSRHPDKTAAVGYHVSHQMPISEFGEGQTFIEPAPLNLARGAHPTETVANQGMTAKNSSQRNTSESRSSQSKASLERG